MHRKTLVIIPAYNASLTISGLIEKISEFIEKSDIVVIDDGSKDETFSIAQNAGAVVLSHKENKGKGEALKTGFKYALEKNYEAVITIDADLQHDPECIPDFIRQANSTNSLPLGERDRVRGNQVEWNKFSYSYCASPDIIIGTRKRNLKIMPLTRWLTNNLTSIILSILSGQTIRDSQSGYRLISTQVLKKVELKAKKYDLESEILVKAGRIGFKIDAIPIRTIYHGAKSFINPFVDTGRFIKLMWRTVWW
jgi:glycosyltransferase involved in cell wall biosynthesis